MSLRRENPVASRYLTLLAAFIVLGLDLGARGQGTGNRIVGSVSWDGAPLPGTTVTVTGRGLTRALITDNEGLFDASNLPEGTYTLIAELAGFQPQREMDVVVASGRATRVALVLSLGCLDIIDYVDLGIRSAVEQADTIVHLRIAASEAPTRWTFEDRA